MQWHNTNSLTSVEYTCGYCGRFVASVRGYFSDHSGRTICICPNCTEPTYFGHLEQVPGVRPGDEVTHLPDNVQALYNEARDCFAANEPRIVPRPKSAPPRASRLSISRSLARETRLGRANARSMHDSAPVPILKRVDPHPSLRSAPIQRPSNGHCQRRENDEIITPSETLGSAPMGGSITPNMGGSIRAVSDIARILAP